MVGMCDWKMQILIDTHCDMLKFAYDCYQQIQLIRKSGATYGFHGLVLIAHNFYSKRALQNEKDQF